MELIQETPGKFKMVLPLIGSPEAGDSEVPGVGGERARAGD